MKEQWIEAPRIEGNQELAEKFGVRSILEQQRV